QRAEPSIQPSETSIVSPAARAEQPTQPSETSIVSPAGGGGAGEPSPAPAPPRAPAKGDREPRPRVTVRSSIDGTVYIDGKRIGDTPLITTVTPGKHELRLEAPGCDPVTSRFALSADGQAEFDLEPHRRRARPAPPPSPEPAPDADSGHLTLTTRPTTTIYLDGRQIGQTPIDLRLATGRHEIKMIGRDQRTRKTMTLDVTAGQESNLSFTFDD